MGKTRRRMSPFLAGAASVALALGAAATSAAAAGSARGAAAPDGKAAAGACSPRLQAFFAVDFTDQSYQQKAYQKVAGRWKRPADLPKAGSKAVVIATIQRDGQAQKPVLHMKSGADAWDAAALASVSGASPFEPLPASYRRDAVEVHFHFECAP
jgi:outer membrane biosynthesis protein TonB